ncbi:MAG TPA: hypothetical protein VFE32_03810 [Puia sp.]|jgi:hypothetical protein|nr:hypothetical protein [Puia sp.]
MKRSFTAPFWVLLVFGLLQLLSISSLLHTFFGSELSSGGRPSVPVVVVLRIFMWPLIFFLEALAYWLIRRRNTYRALSWTHCVIFILAFLLSIFFAYIQRMQYRYSSAAETRVSRQIMMHEQVYFFWGLVILAHLAFVAVLANCRRKAPPEGAEGGQGQGQENLLDDVVL